MIDQACICYVHQVSTVSSLHLLRLGGTNSITQAQLCVDGILYGIIASSIKPMPIAFGLCLLYKIVACFFKVVYTTPS